MLRLAAIRLAGTDSLVATVHEVKTTRVSHSPLRLSSAACSIIGGTRVRQALIGSGGWITRIEGIPKARSGATLARDMAKLGA